MHSQGLERLIVSYMYLQWGGGGGGGLNMLFEHHCCGIEFYLHTKFHFHKWFH